MRNMYWFALALAICHAGASEAQGTDVSVCEKVIEDGLKSVSIQKHNEVNLNEVYDHYCSAGSQVDRNAWSLGVSVVVADLPVNLTAGANSASEKMQNFCRTYKERRESERTDDTYVETMVDRAYQSFDNCISIRSKNATIVHTTNGPAIATIFITPTATVPVEIYGLNATENVTCVGEGSEEGPVSMGVGVNHKVGRNTFTISCTRTKSTTAVGNDYDDAQISLSTNVGPYNFSMAQVPAGGELARVRALMQVEFDTKWSENLKELETLVPTDIWIVDRSNSIKGNNVRLSVLLTCPKGWRPGTPDANWAKYPNENWDVLQSSDVAAFRPKEGSTTATLRPDANGVEFVGLSVAGGDRGSQLFLPTLRCLRGPLSELK